MDDLKNLYYRIENPINNKNKWNRILKIYSTSFNYDSFSSRVINKKEETDNIYYNEKEKEEFYLFMWDLWIKKLLELDDDKIERLIDKREIDYDFYDAINKVKSYPTIKDYSSLLAILTSPLVNRYFSNFFDDFNHQVNIYGDFKLKQNKSYNTVLNISIDAPYLYKILTEYIKKCNEKKIAYYIKYVDLGEEITLDIYTTVENTKLNVAILEELKIKNVLAFNDINDLLSGRITEAITIKNKDLYNAYQYKKERTLILFKSIDSVVYEYLLNHLDMQISYKDGKMDIVNYLATSIMEVIVSDLINKSIKSKKEYFEVANSNDLLNFKKYIKDRILNNMKNILNDRLYLKDSNEKIVINLNKSKNLDIDVDVIMSAIRGLTPVLMSIDKNIETSFKIRIKNECQFYKVDYEKFCLDFGFAKKILFNKEKYNDYEKEVERIQSQITKMDAFKDLTKYSFGSITDTKRNNDNK